MGPNDLQRAFNADFGHLTKHLFAKRTRISPVIDKEISYE